MDTLAMHRTLTGAGVVPAHADAILKVVQGGTVTKQDLEIAVAKLEGRIDATGTRLDRRMDALETGLARRVETSETSLARRIDTVEASMARRIDGVETTLAGRIDRLENKVNLLFGVGLLAVLAPAITRLVVGP